MISRQQKLDYITLTLEELQAKYGYPKDEQSLRVLRSKYKRELKAEGEEPPIQREKPSGDSESINNEELQLQLGAAKNQLRKALAQRDRALDRKSDLHIVIRESIKDLYADLEVKPPQPRELESELSDDEEVAVMLVSDFQLGKKTPSYNSEICEERIQTLAEKAIYLGKLHSKIKPVKEVRVYLLGDLVEGEGIFNGQAHQIDSSLYRQVAVDGPRILGNLLGELLNFFEKVHVVAVIGNHGNLKMNREVNPETNMDRILYQTVRLIYQNEPRVTFDIPEGNGERNFYAVDYVYDWGFLLMHGDQIRGGLSGIGPSTQRKTLGWGESVPHAWDYLCYGHHHNPANLAVNMKDVFCNGTTESGNTYAQETLAAVGAPSQWMFFVNKKYGITSQNKIYLEDRQPNKRRFV